jgi:hypothetical protein
MSPGIHAPEMPAMACKQASMAVGIAVQVHPGNSFLRNPPRWCIRRALFQKLVDLLKSIIAAPS